MEKKLKMEEEKKELPEELINEVSLRLPAKSIARFKTVSKPWNRSFSSSEFVESHTRRAPERIIFIDRTDKIPHVVTPSSGGGGVISKAVQSQIFVDSLASELLNCCNGLVLLRILKGNRKLPLAVINPVTSRAMEVPRYFPYGGGKTGLGYSSSDDDYKIVALTNMFSDDDDPTHPATHVSIFSFRTKTVKQLGDCVYPWIPRRAGVYADGHPHWLAGDEVKPPTIVAFDLSTETFKEVPPPTGFEFRFRRVGTEVLSKLTLLGGCLALVSHNASDAYIGKPIDVWIMEKPGSWRKFTITNYPPVREVQRNQTNPYHNVVSRLGEFEFLLVKSYGELVACNCETGVWREVDIKGFYTGRILSFRENLSSIDAI